MNKEFDILYMKKIKYILIVGILLILITIPFLWIYNILLPFGTLRSHIPALAGLYKEKTYLIVLQNDAELRPGGGFISNFGILNINKGFITDLEIKDSYSLENHDNLREAPEMYSYFLTDDKKFKGWYFRDANSFAEFPSSTEMLMNMYNEQNSEEEKDVIFDGVIAMNFSFIEDLIAHTEGLEINGTSITEENAFALIEHESKNIDKHNAEALKNRKNFIKNLGKDLIKKILYTPSKYREFVDVIVKNLEEKNILIQVTDTSTQYAIDEYNWGGRVYSQLEENQNWIHVNTANLGGRKADRYMQKNIEYHLSINEKGEKRVHFISTFNHRGTYNINSDLYRANIRIFMPERTVLEKNWGDFVKRDTKWKIESKKNKKGNYVENAITLLPGERRIIHFQFLLPENTIPNETEKNMSLEIIKQPGSRENWSVTVQDIGNRSFKNTEENSFRIHENTAFWNGELLKDTKLELERINDTIPPVVAWQGFWSINEVIVNFSESMLESSVINPENYYMSDNNYIDKNTDNISIEEIKYDSEKNKVILITSGISEAEEERYTLEMKNIFDASGNELSEAQRKITLVQRIKK